MARTDAYQDALRARAHQMQTRLVRGTAAHDHRHRHLTDELLEIERFGGLRDVLGRDDGALDDQDVEAGLERELVVAVDLLRSERRGADHAVLLDLADALGHELGLDRLLVDLLHLPGRRLLREGGDLLELRLRILVAGPDALEVEDREPAEVAEDARCLRRDDAVHRGREQRKLEAVRPERPADVYVVRVTRAPRGHDRDVIEPVGPATLFATSDLDLHWQGTLGLAAD